jgi:LPS export ABC transporter protein LptC
MFKTPPYYIIAVFLVSIAFLSASCEKKIETIKKSAIESLPSTTIINGETTYSDSAKKQLVMSAPLMERYTDRKNPFTEFRKGIVVTFYDGHDEPVGTLTAKYAKYLEDKRLWELKDSVVAVNEKKDIVETELLYWDQNKELVYTDRFVKITSVDQIMMGTGLESDPRFVKPVIRNVSAQFYIKENEE